jgi:hypothetical protein
LVGFAQEPLKKGDLHRSASENRQKRCKIASFFRRRRLFSANFDSLYRNYRMRLLHSPLVLTCLNVAGLCNCPTSLQNGNIHRVEIAWLN